ncbi:class F sortase [Sciscionella marina]|uniref:class F sortase n=1 Tax=Sciscionella marina TaxID=508770 RepID=UPI00037053E9|nr:class F sortase [Sciscionella marina]
MRKARLATAVVAAVAPALLAAGCAGPSAQPAGQAAPKPAASSAPQAGMPRSTPVRLDIPSIGAESGLVPLGLQSDGSVAVPPVSQPRQAGWYRNGPTPGQVGPSVVLGHVDGNHKKGIFYDLDKVKAGQEVDIARADGKTARFRVRAVDQVPKDEFPTQAVYGNTTKPELRLITCGGSFNRAERSYRDNVIVYADLFRG